MANIVKYDFLSVENRGKWEKELCPGLRKVIDNTSTPFVKLIT